MTKPHEQLVWDARQAGFHDAYYDGLDMEEELPCTCDECRKAYREGGKAAVEKIFDEQGLKK